MRFVYQYRAIMTVIRPNGQETVNHLGLFADEKSWVAKRRAQQELVKQMSHIRGLIKSGDMAGWRVKGRIESFGKTEAWHQGNPCRLKGRKTKAGRSVTLRNMRSVTIIRRRNGTVGIRGVKK